ncbi:hypothetical protein SISSUDRAFT_1059120 [Sistotremastrum suecicum HHB10207 ss-3]|uniref:SHSP domain-containing protein n=1 Tax=Sistotremastrum suecicum HHB10207 ss-3 TaxID=1314776 RepID=A0A166GLN6_9AGAM|nr:hypothetical protein SISSUDRAFT_1059120 [Sistotremastrum suecicum HHB10207 ss-3]
MSHIEAAESDEAGVNTEQALRPRPNAKRNHGIPRSLSHSALGSHMSQCPALSQIMTASSRSKSEQLLLSKLKALRRAESSNIRSSSSRQFRHNSMPARQTDLGVPKHKATVYKLEGSRGASAPACSEVPRSFASGPLPSVIENGVDEKPVPIRSSPEVERNQSYLIRTDMNYSRADDTVTVLMELPGLKMGDVSLRLATHSTGVRNLYVEGVSKRPTDIHGEVAMQERLYGRMTRTLIVPSHVKASDIEAHMQDGILRMKIPGTKFEDVEIKMGPSGASY